jgi:aspartate aminotransferase
MGISAKARTQMNASSWIRRTFEEGIELKRIHGADKVFDLSLGNPVLEPPSEFVTELTRLATDEVPGAHGYMPNAGYPDVRAAVAETLARESEYAFTGEEIIMTCGAAAAVNVTFKSILDPGDEVVIIAPYFGEYFFYVDNHGGQAVVAESDEGFQPDLGSLSAAITERTRAVLINSPNNPTGVIYPESTLIGIASVIQDAEKRFGTEIFLVSDEAYRKLIYSNEAYPLIYSYHERSVVVTSHSKDLGLAGERIGYIAVNPNYADRGDFVDAAIFANRTLGFVSAPALMQRVVAKLQNSTVDMAQYRNKRDFIYGELTSIGYECIRPDGAFYLFPKSPIEDDKKFVALLQSKLVLAVPGTGFGRPGYFRLSFSTDDRTLEGAIPGFKAAFEEATG